MSDPWNQPTVVLVLRLPSDSSVSDQQPAPIPQDSLPLSATTPSIDLPIMKQRSSFDSTEGVVLIQ